MNSNYYKSSDGIHFYKTTSGEKTLHVCLPMENKTVSQKAGPFIATSQHRIGQALINNLEFDPSVESSRQIVPSSQEEFESKVKQALFMLNLHQYAEPTIL